MWKKVKSSEINMEENLDTLCNDTGAIWENNTNTELGDLTGDCGETSDLHFMPGITSLCTGIDGGMWLT
jgi:hypothetical protein